MEEVVELRLLVWFGHSGVLTYGCPAYSPIDQNQIAIMEMKAMPRNKKLR